MPETSKTAVAFDIFTRNRLESTTLEKIWRQACDADYATEARPNAFYPQSVLDAIAASVGKAAQDSQILEIGCGHGLTGRYLARRLRAERYCGIDISPGSTDLARSLAREDVAAQQMKSSFWVADAVSTGAEDASYALVVCLDVLIYLSDKSAAMNETARVLAPGGFFAFTTWEQEGGHNDRISALQVTDYRPLLKKAGLEVLIYQEVEGWRAMQSRVFQGIIKAEAELQQEVGKEMAEMWINMAKGGQKEMATRRYVFGLAQRQG